MKKILSLFVLLSSCSQAQKSDPVNFLPNNPAIEYNGRIDFSDPLKPQFCYSGVSIKTVLLGSSLSMVMNDQSQSEGEQGNYYNVIVDDSVYKILAVKRGKQTYELVSDLPAGKHTIEVYKRTECSIGSSCFLGFTASAGTRIEKPKEKTHRIEFIGNSITCGYGNDTSIAAPPEGNPNSGFHTKHENNYLSYGSITARNLNAVYQCVAYSGRGLYRNNTGSEEGTMPKIYARIFPDDADSKLWDFKKAIPDVVVINLGTNDFFPEAQGDFVDEKLFSQTYLQFIKELRTRYPSVTFVCTVGSMMSDLWPEDRQCWTRIQTLVKQVIIDCNNTGDKNVYYFKFEPQTPPYGESWHPSVLTHKKMATALTSFIKELVGW